MVLVGGVRTPSDALVGPVAVTAIRRLNVDVLFLGVHGMTFRAGFATPNMTECGRSCRRTPAAAVLASEGSTRGG
ncbi:hypothetical protein ACIBP6_18400 [Nonomuraea terrae]|uniref:hypothetical protein n=1 Tax=Nonomuraea terrae TaxID=2530383 RepID=UPI00378FE9C5